MAIFNGFVANTDIMLFKQFLAKARHLYFNRNDRILDSEFLGEEDWPEVIFDKQISATNRRLTEDITITIMVKRQPFDGAISFKFDTRVILKQNFVELVDCYLITIRAKEFFRHAYGV